MESVTIWLVGCLMVRWSEKRTQTKKPQLHIKTMRPVRVQKG